jgi:hypothetical protein
MIFITKPLFKREIGNRCIEGICDFRNIFQRWIPFCPFDPAYVGTIKLAGGSQISLGHFQFNPSITNPRSKNDHGQKPIGAFVVISPERMVFFFHVSMFSTDRRILRDMSTCLSEFEI